MKLSPENAAIVEKILGAALEDPIAHLSLEELNELMNAARDEEGDEDDGPIFDIEEA